MKKLFLTSSMSDVAAAVAHDIGKDKIKLTYIPTAIEPYPDPVRMAERKRILSASGFEISEFSVTGKKKEEIIKELSGKDAVLVGGGNTFYLLDKMRGSGADEVIKKFVEDGGIYIGSSAGSLFAGPDIYTAATEDDISLAPNLKDFTGLELVDFVVYPHMDSDNPNINYRELVEKYRLKNKIIFLTDREYIQVVDDMYKIEEVPQQ